MVPVERPKTNEKFASREKILKCKTGFRLFAFPSIVAILPPLSPFSRKETVGSHWLVQAKSDPQTCVSRSQITRVYVMID
jgi:hypothetical protein